MKIKTTSLFTLFLVMILFQNAYCLFSNKDRFDEYYKYSDHYAVNDDWKITLHAFESYQSSKSEQDTLEYVIRIYLHTHKDVLNEFNLKTVKILNAVLILEDNKELNIEYSKIDGSIHKQEQQDNFNSLGSFNLCTITYLSKPLSIPSNYLDAKLKFVFIDGKQTHNIEIPFNRKNTESRWDFHCNGEPKESQY